MKRSKWIIGALAALALVGCATNDGYYKALEAQAKATEKIGIERARAAGKACEYGDSTACLMSQVMLGMQGAGAGQQALPQVAPPKTFADYALQFTGVLAPSLVQGYGAYTNMRLGMTQSDNATRLGIAQSRAAADTAQSTNNAFVSMGGQIRDTGVAGVNAVGSTAAAGFASNTAIGDAGFRAIASTAGAGLNAAYGISTAGFGSNASIAGQIQAPQPAITISGTGSVNTGAGDSSFTQTASTGSVIGAGQAQTLAGNGVIGSGSYTRKDCSSTGAASGAAGAGAQGGNGAAGGTGGNGGNATGTTGTVNGGAAGAGGLGGNGAVGGNGGNSGPGGAAAVGC